MYKRMFFIECHVADIERHVTSTITFRASNSGVPGTHILESENGSDISIIDAIVTLYNNDEAYHSAYLRQTR